MIAIAVIESNSELVNAIASDNVRIPTPNETPKWLIVENGSPIRMVSEDKYKEIKRGRPVRSIVRKVYLIGSRK